MSILTTSMEGIKSMKNLLRFFLLLFVLLCNVSLSNAQWVQTSGPNITVQSLAVISKNLFAGTNNGVFLTTNNGTSWTKVNTGLADTGISALASIGTNLFASTASGVFLTTNNGTSWKQVNSGLTDTTIRTLATVGANLFATANGAGIFVSTNNGSSWTSANGSVFQNAYIALLAGTGTSLFASTTSDNIIYRSMDNGATWQKADSGISGANVIVQSGTNLIAGGVSGVFLSTNNAVSWNPLTTAWGLQNSQIIGFATSGSNVYGVGDAQVLVGANNGTSWSGIVLPSFFDEITSVAIIDTNLFIGTNNNSDFVKSATVWRVSTKQAVTGVKTQSSNAPTSFSLQQNYPNPFNPSTVIQFTVPSSGRAVLKVFNILGQEVATLFDGVAAAGEYHQETFDASRLASGIYFSRLEFDGKMQMKKMLLLK